MNNPVNVKFKMNDPVNVKSKGLMGEKQSCRIELSRAINLLVGNLPDLSGTLPAPVVSISRNNTTWNIGGKINPYSRLLLATYFIMKT